MTGITWAITIYLWLSALTTAVVIWCGTTRYKLKLRQEEQRHKVATGTDALFERYSEPCELYPYRFLVSTASR